jgi:uncharacterized protein DUF1553/uncharacterized protein DUF1549/cytochrome c
MIRLFLAVSASFFFLAPVRSAGPAVDFDREIRPILSDNCFKCHGPDEKERKAKLRLDDRAAALKSDAFIPGNSSESMLVSRITNADPGKRMPPAKSGKKLTPAQIALLKRWIDQGANYSIHWSFVPPQRPPVPIIRNPKSEIRNAIDAFVLDRLEKEGLSPSPEADRTTLIRRLTLDLTGLPPTPKEVDDFLNDRSADAYSKLVDRLLESSRYGERMALDWLDAARFADTHGYHIDSGRDMTRWREWVINSFNSNKRFDQFTIEQLAGDLLPKPTLEQRIASGFNRNHMINFEGGAIPEEYHTAYIVDRVSTTGTVWMGLSVGCAQCHDHKFDPITQKEFYELFAFFNNVPENGLDGSHGNAMPFIKAPSSEQQRKLDELAATIAGLEKELAGPMPAVDAEQKLWEVEAAKATTWTPVRPKTFTSLHEGGAKLTLGLDGVLHVSKPLNHHEGFSIAWVPEDKRVTAIRIDVLPEPRGRKLLSPSDNGNFVLTHVAASSTIPGKTDGAQALSIRKASADFEQDGFVISSAVEGTPKGWAIYPKVGEPHWAVFELAEPFVPDGRHELRLSFSFDSVFDHHVFTRFRLSATDAADPHRASLPADVGAAFAVTELKRSAAQATAIRSYYRQNVSPNTRELVGKIASLKKDRSDLENSVPTAMVMQEMGKPRDTFMLVRGQYDKHGDKVAAAIPSFLPPLPKDAPHNRLGLARWLVDPNHPLTARVTVNRYWQMFFGIGIVKSAEDFGTQGEYPSHRELLDWLATEFVRTGWDVKALVKMMVMSSTYRQSSKVSPEQEAKDPENRLLSRASRLRLPAEFIRDQALAVSELLNDEIGGRSVFPYQPPGLWEELMSRSDGANWTAQTYTPSKGKDLYRRTMYTFWKRTCPPPTLATFDAPDREVCTVRRPRTNTPLQALILMNDPTYIEASRKLAERLMREAKTVDNRITLAFRLYTGRPPTAEEMTILRRVFEARLAKYRNDSVAAEKLLSVGESPRDKKLDAAELAAWASVASVILNLDETVTRG